MSQPLVIGQIPQIFRVSVLVRWQKGTKVNGNGKKRPMWGVIRVARIYGKPPEEVASWLTSLIYSSKE